MSATVLGGVGKTLKITGERYVCVCEDTKRTKVLKPGRSRRESEHRNAVF